MTAGFAVPFGHIPTKGTDPGGGIAPFGHKRAKGTASSGVRRTLRAKAREGHGETQQNGPGISAGPVSFWWPYQDSNLEPVDYESIALTVAP